MRITGGLLLKFISKVYETSLRGQMQCYFGGLNFSEMFLSGSPIINYMLSSEGRDQNYEFYEEFRKVHSTAHLLGVQLQELSHSRDQVWKRLLAFEKKTEEDFRDQIRGEAPEKKKRSRRTAGAIEKVHACPVEKCFRTYGTQGSLLQHMKIKHPKII